MKKMYVATQTTVFIADEHLSEQELIDAAKKYATEEHNWNGIRIDDIKEIKTSSQIPQEWKEQDEHKPLIWGTENEELSASEFLLSAYK